MKTRSSARRWLALSVATFAAGAILGAVAARADVTVERAMKSGGLGGFGASDSTTVEKISGLRKRDVTSMKMSGFLGKVAGETGGDEITDIPKDVVWKLDHKKKTYTESPITPPPQPKSEQGSGRAEPTGEEKPNVRIVRNEITVKEPGDRKTIGAYDCVHYVVTWIVETENLETKERSESTMVSDLWTTGETAEIRALQKEEMEFTKAWLKRIGWDITDRQAQKMGLAMVGALIGGDEESMKKGAKEVAEKLEQIKGYPIGTGVTWRLRGSGGEGGKSSGSSAASEGESGMPDIAKGLGGLMSAFGKKVSKSAAESSGAKKDPGGAKTIFDTYTEIRRISTASLPDSDFAPPPGYEKVE